MDEMQDPLEEPLNPEVAILNAALELPTANRAAYLDEACAGASSSLRRQVEALLDAHERADDFLTGPPAGLDYKRTGSANIVLTEKPGDKIGRYKLLQQIGEGGCGVVYMAEQQEPVRRRVALKVIKLGMDTKSVIARFEAERQALALMDHPNIAKVLDAGATEAGRPYFVMELVRGNKVTDYCDQNNLGTRARLNLFVQICRAIQHAHQKGIIHRDIKPSNILVTINDGVVVPKVIDFAIAKATQGRLTDKTLFTAFDQFVGTPAYMSPEQAVMTSVDMDTRSDIYSLGVLLYELLTGRTPFDPKELLASGLDEMRRTIQEKEPVRPSTCLSTMIAGDLTTAARQRQTDAPKLIHVVRGDLDWVVMKALEKDRSRRYETANGLASDIQRHLNNEPVNARPPTAVYRLQKLVRRNKAAFIIAAVVALSAMLALVVLAISNVRILAARHAEHIERQRSDAANRDLISSNARLAETVNIMELRRAEDMFTANDSAAGLAHLTGILRRDPSNHIAASRLVSALVQRNWALPTTPPLRHAGKVESVAFSPDGLRILCASDKAVQILDAVTGSIITKMQYEGKIISASYRPNGPRILMATSDGTARIWQNGEPVGAPLPHDGKIHWAEFSPDDNFIVTASADATVRVWDSVSGTLKHQLGRETNDFRIARFSPDGRQIATGGGLAPVCIWSTESGEMLFRLGETHAPANTLIYSPDGRRLLSVSGFGRAQLWNPTSGEAIGQPLVHNSKLLYATFSRDSRMVATCNDDGGVRLWNTENGSPIGRTMSHDGGVTFAEFSPDGQLLATASVDNSARVWHVGAGALFCQPLHHAERVVEARFSPHGARLVTGGEDGVVQIWDLQYRRDPGLKMKHQNSVMAVAFNSSGELVLTASLDNTAQLWNARTGHPLNDPMRYEDGVESAEFAPDGTRLVTASNDGTAHVRNAATGQIVAGPLRHAKAIWAAGFSPDGGRVATASADGTARIWDAATGQPLTAPLVHDAGIVSVRFSVDGRYVVTASKDSSARVWNAATGQAAGEPLRHIDDLKWAEFSPDGSKIVTASSDNTACIWNAQTSRLIARLLHARIVDRAMFSPDGRRVLTASLDRTAGIWDAESGELLIDPIKHGAPISRGASFSPDGRRIATGSWNGSVRIWDVDTGLPMTEWTDGGSDVLTLAFDRTNRRMAAGARDGSVRVWEVPPVPTPTPNWLPKFAEAMGGIRLGLRGKSERVPSEEFDSFARQFARGTRTNFYENVAQWFLADPKKRATSPF